MRVSIIDDEAPAVRLLSKYVDKTADLTLALATTDALGHIDQVTAADTDLLLLDIQMPDILGVDLLRQIPDPPIVIFTTAYTDYAIDGYDLDVVDYLLKPISYDRFLRGIEKAKHHLPGLTPKTIESPTHLELTIDYKKVRIAYTDILYIQGLKDYVKVYTTQGLRLTRLSIKGIDSLIQHPSLKRVHRSYIVNLDHVSATTKTSLAIDGIDIPIGRSYR